MSRGELSSGENVGRNFLDWEYLEAMSGSPLQVSANSSSDCTVRPPLFQD